MLKNDPCHESVFAKVYLQEGRERKGFHPFSTSALWKLSVGKYLSTRITQYFCQVLN